jgi:hypothetical protein
MTATSGCSSGPTATGESRSVSDTVDAGEVVPDALAVKGLSASGLSMGGVSGRNGRPGRNTLHERDEKATMKAASAVRGRGVRRGRDIV